MKNQTSQLKTEGATVEAAHLTCGSIANTAASNASRQATVHYFDMTAVKISNGKTYKILREFIAPVTWEPPYAGNPVVDYQAFNPKSGEPWQAIRTALKSEFHTFIGA